MNNNMQNGIEYKVYGANDCFSFIIRINAPQNSKEKSKIDVKLKINS